MKEIISEIQELSQSIDCIQLNEIIDQICECNGSFFGIGAGRMGYAVQSFMMRLKHLGKNAFYISDSNIPSVRKDDLLIINSSSGETEIVYQYTKLAKKYTNNIVLLTQNKESRIGELASNVLVYKKISSTQLLKTLCEQFSFILMDHIAQSCFEKLGLSIKQVTDNHFNLE